ncbi:MAG TPA: four helix bundle protein [Geobacter sp.]|nr:four helix bundle protein [Geobacter sp.]
MKIERFEDIESWKEARLLVNDVYRALRTCKDFGFCSQLQRAAVSVMSNIAEGFDRGSNREFIQFLVVSRGSVAEVKSLLYAGVDIGHLDQEAFDKLMCRCVKVTSLLDGFLRFLRGTPRKA